MLRAERDVAEDLRVGLETHERAVGFVPVFPSRRFQEFPSVEDRSRKLASAVAANLKPARERVDRFGPDAVQPHAELEDLVAVLCARVDARNAFDDFAERNAATEVAHRDPGAVEIDRDAFAVAHNEFVNGVVHDFLQQDVDAVVVVGPVADPADVHPCALADVLQGGERFDLVLVVIVFCRRHRRAGF